MASKLIESCSSDNLGSISGDESDIEPAPKSIDCGYQYCQPEQPFWQQIDLKLSHN